jgi:hypothetical protein
MNGEGELRSLQNAQFHSHRILSASDCKSRVEISMSSEALHLPQPMVNVKTLCLLQTLTGTVLQQRMPGRALANPQYRSIQTQDD